MTNSDMARTTNLGYNECIEKNVKPCASVRMLAAKKIMAYTISERASDEPHVLGNEQQEEL